MSSKSPAFTLTLALLLASTFCACASKSASVTVDWKTDLGPIKVMNAANNGPKGATSDQTRSNFLAYKALRVPYVRNHDAAFMTMQHSDDITAIFPNFDADENDPKSYDFALTDGNMKIIQAAGSKPFFRLGQTIEHWTKKYGVNPPRDFAKWARICEHVIRHYNEGWADGFRMGIEYWEIWNEPDNLPTADGRQSPTWTGTETQFHELFATTAKHLKTCFPNLKIGGPALSFDLNWADRFLGYCQRNSVPLDFFSWHLYHDGHDGWYANKSAKIREVLDRHGYRQCESIMDEWNYVSDWGAGWIYSLEVESGRLNLKGAAYSAAVMCDNQNAPVDMLMYYDMRVGSPMNGIFDSISLLPLKGYYPFYAWSKLRDLGMQVKATADDGDIRVVAARSADGRHGAALVVRYNNDNNVVAGREVRLNVPGVSLAGARCHLTDIARTYSEVPLSVQEDGTATLLLLPWSFALIEW